jgi:hypothetical protein
MHDGASDPRPAATERRIRDLVVPVGMDDECAADGSGRGIEGVAGPAEIVTRSVRVQVTDALRLTVRLGRSPACGPRDCRPVLVAERVV